MCGLYALRSLIWSVLDLSWRYMVMVTRSMLLLWRTMKDSLYLRLLRRTRARKASDLCHFSIIRVLWDVTVCTQMIRKPSAILSLKCCTKFCGTALFISSESENFFAGQPVDSIGIEQQKHSHFVLYIIIAEIICIYIYSKIPWLCMRRNNYLRSVTPLISGNPVYVYPNLLVVPQ